MTPLEPLTTRHEISSGLFRTYIYTMPSLEEGKIWVFTERFVQWLNRKVDDPREPTIEDVRKQCAVIENILTGKAQP